MGFLDTVKLPETLGRTPTARPPSGRFLSSVVVPQDQTRANELVSLQRQADEARKESEKLSGFGVVKETGRQIVKRTVTAGKNFFKNISQTYSQFPSKIAEDISEAADDIAKGEGVKGVAKATVRTTGDTLITLFSPISAAIGAALELTDGQTLIDKTGEVIADKSGIANIEAFQKFAMEHPNAGEDFDRLLFLGLVGAGAAKGKGEVIDPKRIAREAKTFANKIVSTTLKPKAVQPQVAGGFLESVRKPEVKTETKIAEPRVDVKVSEELPTVEKRVEVPQKVGEKPSKVALSIEERSIEKKLTEGFEGKAGFDPITIKEQSRLVSDLIKTDIEKAKRMVRGEEIVPENLRGSALLVGLEESALKSGDASLLKDLAQSPLTAETSRFGQELRILAERSPESPVKAIQDVIKARETAFEARTKKKSAKVKKDAIKEIKSEIKKNASKRPTWEEFINEIKCNF